MKRRHLFAALLMLLAVACTTDTLDPDPVPEPEPTPAPAPEPEPDPEPVIEGQMHVIKLRVAGGVDVASRDDYVSASVNGYAARVRGRGNSSWWNTPKKSYRISMDEKLSLLDRPADRSWCLIANYFDRSMLRNALTFHMGSEWGRFDYTTPSDFVQLYLNGSFHGVYQLLDHLEIARHRVPGDVLLEIDSRAEADDVSFSATRIWQPIVIKDPEGVVTGDETYCAIRDFVLNAESVMYSDSWLDEQSGWRSVIDEDSLVDWYLLNEISKNNDACFYTSCYFNFSWDGKLKLGPLWDYDGAYGNTTYNGNDSYKGLWIATTVEWYKRLLTDPYFKSLVKERFEFWYSLQDELCAWLDAYAEWLEPYVMQDDEVWHSLSSPDIWNAVETFDNYKDYVTSLENWIRNRFDWLKDNFISGL